MVLEIVVLFSYVFNLEAVLWLLSEVCVVTGLVFTITTFTTVGNLESDRMNPTSCTRELNMQWIPEYAAQALLFLFLISYGHWMAALIQVGVSCGRRCGTTSSEGQERRVRALRRSERGASRHIMTLSTGGGVPSGYNYGTPSL